MKFRLESVLGTHYLYLISPTLHGYSSGEQLIGTYLTEEQAMEAAKRFKENWELTRPTNKVFTL